MVQEEEVSWKFETQCRSCSGHLFPQWPAVIVAMVAAVEASVVVSVVVVAAVEVVAVKKVVTQAAVISSEFETDYFSCFF